VTREQLAADRDRQDWLTERGWRLLHSTAVDVYREHERMIAACQKVERQSRARTSAR
jgi:very-short-patch-repair endonuclease